MNTPMATMMTPHPTLETSRPFYLVADLPRRYGFSRTHWYNEWRRGRITFRKSGSRAIVLHADLMAYLNNLPVAE